MNPLIFAAMSTDMNTQTNSETWTSAWPDALAFAIGLAVAWWTRWTAGDLVWSLWLSSLVVGYSLILWLIAQPAMEFAGLWRRQRQDRGTWRQQLGFWIVFFSVVAFFVGFFTVHFVGFHYGHSQFLISFFPIDTGQGRPNDANMATYAEVVRRYWPFLPSAFLAHRAAFRRRSFSLEPRAAGFKLGSKGFAALFTEPYRNVIRMHLLIFFFAFAYFARLENFAVYAVTYAVYFFPWRLVRRSQSTAPVLLQRAD